MNATHAYLGRKVCGCVVAITVDDTDNRKWTADAVAEFIRDGLTVDRVTIEDGRKALNFCQCERQAELPMEAVPS